MPTLEQSPITISEHCITISEHCIDRYLERVARCLRRQRAGRVRARRELAFALSHPPLCSLACGEGWLVGVQSPIGYRFMVKLDATRTIAETCGPIWFWHEARKHWRAVGIDPKKLSKGNKKPGAGFAARLQERQAQGIQAQATDEEGTC